VAYVEYHIYNRLNQEAKPASGYCLPFDTFTFVPDFTNTNIIISNKKVIWDFGDGTTSTVLSSSHYYSYPGNYPVTLTVFDSGGNTSTSTYMSAVKVYNAVEDAVILTTDSNLVLKSGQNNGVIYVTRYNSSATSISGANTIITLSVSGNKAPFYDAEMYDADKYAHLKSLARFAIDTPLGLTVVDSVTTTNIPLYALPSTVNTSITLTNSSVSNTYYAGSSGTASFFYVEDFV